MRAKHPGKVFKEHTEGAGFTKRLARLLAERRSGTLDGSSEDNLKDDGDGPHHGVLERLGSSQHVAVGADRSAQELLATAVEQAGNSFMITDAQGAILYVNPAFERQTGYSASEVIGENPRLLSSGFHDRDFYSEMWAALSAGQSVHRVFRNTRKDGSTFFWEQTIAPVVDAQGSTTHYVSSGRDITRERLLEERLDYLAKHDVLTGLGNRRLFEQVLRDRLGGVRLDQERVAVLLIQLDGFRRVNQTLGRLAGDHVLTAVARRIRATVREHDVVVRLGGDEFAILSLGASSEIASQIAGRVLASVRKPILVANDRVEISCSIGIAVFPDHADQDGSLIQKADQALQRAKHARNADRFLDELADAALYDRSVLENELRKALRERTLTVAYQPIIDSRQGRTYRVEALARWTHPSRGVVSPVDFIPIAEDAGLVTAVDYFVLEQSLAELSQYSGRQPNLSVNFSPRTLRDPDMPVTVQQLHEQYGVPMSSTCVELTEHSLFDANDELGSIQTLRDLGIRLSLDDFGTGYSALSYLQRVPLDEVKIDRSFVAALEDVGEEDTPVLLRGIIRLINELQLDCVAEGVETNAQSAWLQGESCTLMQGYWIARPQPADQTLEWLQRHPPCDLPE